MSRLQRAVEGVGGADKAEVSEGLREISKMLAGRTQLLGVKADVIRVAEHLLKNESALQRIARTR